MSVEATVEIDVGEFANDGQFCDLVSDIVRDTLNSESWIVDAVDEHMDDKANDSLDPNSDAFINAVALALYNMARSYVGA
tara:strand:+ start:54 stop:293 length:240 start_codon:yes stop_codon:yes gene_type:complete